MSDAKNINHFEYRTNIKLITIPTVDQKKKDKSSDFLFFLLSIKELSDLNENQILKTDKVLQNKSGTRC